MEDHLTILEWGAIASRFGDISSDNLHPLTRREGGVCLSAKQEAQGKTQSVESFCQSSTEKAGGSGKKYLAFDGLHLQDALKCADEGDVLVVFADGYAHHVRRTPGASHRSGDDSLFEKFL